MTQNERLRAHEAAYILESEVFNDSFTMLDARYVKEWRGAAETAARELAWLKQRILQEVRRELLESLKKAALSPDGKEFREKLTKIEV